jgi:hypothetical protein
MNMGVPVMPTQMELLPEIGRAIGGVLAGEAKGYKTAEQALKKEKNSPPYNNEAPPYNNNGDKEKLADELIAAKMRVESAKAAIERKKKRATYNYFGNPKTNRFSEAIEKMDRFIKTYIARHPDIHWRTRRDFDELLDDFKKIRDAGKRFG